MIHPRLKEEGNLKNYQNITAVKITVVSDGQNKNRRAFTEKKTIKITTMTADSEAARAYGAHKNKTITLDMFYDKSQILYDDFLKDSYNLFSSRKKQNSAHNRKSQINSSRLAKGNIFSHPKLNVQKHPRTFQRHLHQSKVNERPILNEDSRVWRNKPSSIEVGPYPKASDPNFHRFQKTSLLIRGPQITSTNNGIQGSFQSRENTSRPNSRSNLHFGFIGTHPGSTNGHKSHNESSLTNVTNVKSNKSGLSDYIPTHWGNMKTSSHSDSYPHNEFLERPTIIPNDKHSTMPNSVRENKAVNMNLLLGSAIPHWKTNPSDPSDNSSVSQGNIQQQSISNTTPTDIVTSDTIRNHNEGKQTIYESVANKAKANEIHSGEHSAENSAKLENVSASVKDNQAYNRGHTGHHHIDHHSSKDIHQHPVNMRAPNFMSAEQAGKESGAFQNTVSSSCSKNTCNKVIANLWHSENVNANNTGIETEKTSSDFKKQSDKNSTSNPFNMTNYVQNFLKFSLPHLGWGKPATGKADSGNFNTAGNTEPTTKPPKEYTTAQPLESFNVSTSATSELNKTGRKTIFVRANSAAANEIDLRRLISALHAKFGDSVNSQQQIKVPSNGNLNNVLNSYTPDVANTNTLVGTNIGSSANVLPPLTSNIAPPSPVSPLNSNTGSLESAIAALDQQIANLQSAMSPINTNIGTMAGLTSSLTSNLGSLSNGASSINLNIGNLGTNGALTQGLLNSNIGKGIGGISANMMFEPEIEQPNVGNPVNPGKGRTNSLNSNGLLAMSNGMIANQNIGHLNNLVSSQGMNLGNGLNSPVGNMMMEPEIEQPNAMNAASSGGANTPSNNPLASLGSLLSKLGNLNGMSVSGNTAGAAGNMMLEPEIEQPNVGSAMNKGSGGTNTLLNNNLAALRSLTSGLNSNLASLGSLTSPLNTNLGALTSIASPGNGIGGTSGNMVLPEMEQTNFGNTLNSLSGGTNSLTSNTSPNVGGNSAGLGSGSGGNSRGMSSLPMMMDF